MVNLPPVSSPTRFAKNSTPPNSVSSDLGKLDARRQFSVGRSAAIAGAVSATAAAPLAALINLRLSMLVSLIFMVGCASL